MSWMLHREGRAVRRRRAARLIKHVELEGIDWKPRTSIPNPEAKKCYRLGEGGSARR
jgi:hypothetical protein